MGGKNATIFYFSYFLSVEFINCNYLSNFRNVFVWVSVTKQVQMASTDYFSHVCNNALFIGKKAFFFLGKTRITYCNICDQFVNQKMLEL